MICPSIEPQQTGRPRLGASRQRQEGQVDKTALRRPFARDASLNSDGDAACGRPLHDGLSAMA